MSMKNAALAALAKKQLAGSGAANYQPFDDAEDMKDNGADEATEDVKARMPMMPMSGYMPSPLMPGGKSEVKLAKARPSKA